MAISIGETLGIQVNFEQVEQAGQRLSMLETQMKTLLTQINSSGKVISDQFASINSQVQGGNWGSAFVNLISGMNTSMQTVNSLKTTLGEMGVSFESIKTAMGSFTLPFDTAKITETGQLVETLGTQFNDVNTQVTDLATGISERFTAISGLLAEGNYGGAFIELIGGMGQTLEAIGPLKESISSIIGTIQSLSSVLGITLGPIGLVATAIAGLAALFIYLWNTNDTFRNGVITVWETIKSAVSTVLGIIGPLISNVFNTIWSIVQSVMGFISNLMSTAWPAIQSVISTVWNTIKTVISTVISFIQSFISTGMTIIKTVITTVLNVIKTIFSTIFTAIQTVVTTVINVVRTIIQTGMNVVRTVISTVLNTIKAVFTTIFNTVKGVVTGAISFVQNFISTGISAARTAVMNGLNAIKNTFSNIFDTVRSSVSNAMNNIKTAISDGIQNAWQAVLNFVGRFREAGKNIVNSIAEGITSAVGAVKDAISNVAGKIRDFLPFSPAKEGPLQDIHRLNFGGPIKDSIYRDVPKIEHAFEKALTLPSLHDIGSSLGRGLARLDSNVQARELQGLSANPSSNMTIEVPVHLEGKQIAKVTAPFMDVELGRRGQMAQRARGHY